MTEKNNENNIQFNKVLAAKLTVHILCQCLLWSQILVPGFSYADSDTESESTVSEGYTDYTAVQEENQDNEAEAATSDGTTTSCSEVRTTYDTYTASQESYTSYTSNLTSQIASHLATMNGEDGTINSLLEEQAAYMGIDTSDDDTNSELTSEHDELKQRKNETYQAWQDAIDAQAVAEAEYNAAHNYCYDSDGDRSWRCSGTNSDGYIRLQTARSNLAAANQNVINTKADYDEAIADLKRFERNFSSEAAVADTTTNANAMEDSHEVSGCGTNYDITTNTDEECELSGALYEADQQLASLVNDGITEAKALAAERVETLLQLELEQQYAADYQLYDLAVNNVTTETEDGEDVRSTEQTISNLQTMGLASTMVRNVACETHTLSDAEPQSFWLFKAAAATWLTAVVNDTDYYAGQSACMAEEAITSDENNEQIQTIERAANITEQELIALCLKIRPTIPDTDADDFDWRYYGDTYEQAMANIDVLKGYTDDEGNTHPPLAERCDAYLQELLGDSYDDDYEMTREYALTMVSEALGVAQQEYAAKISALGTAYANVIKGEQWVARVQKNIITATALAALVLALANNFAGICSTVFGGWACPIAAKLYNEWGFITATVIAVWLMSELARAQSYLAKWREKLHRAKHYTHMACNFEDAKAEEDDIIAIGEEYQAMRQEEMRKANNSVISTVNDLVEDAIQNSTSTSSSEGSSTFNYDQSIKGSLDKLNEMITGVPDLESAKKALSQIMFKNENKWERVSKTLALMGVELVAMPIGDAHAADEEEILTTTDALNIASGTGNFKYFLVQRNQWFQNVTNDITNQPEHSVTDSEISDSGSGVYKNVDGGTIVSVDALAAPYVGGASGDPLDGLDDLQKTGMATPETRVILLQNAYELFLDNIGKLNGSIAQVGSNLDQYVSLLNAARREMEIEDEGLGDVESEEAVTVSKRCVAADGSIDGDCECKNSSSCLTFTYPTFSAEIPDALKTSGNLAMKTANDVVSGNLSGAGVSGGALSKNASRVTSVIAETDDQFANSTSSSSVSSSGSNGLVSASESKVSKTLNKVGDNANSSFNKVRNSMMNKGLGSSDAGRSTASKSSDSDSSSSKSDSTAASEQSVKSGDAIGEDKVSNEKFSLTGMEGTNMNLAELTDEEKRRLGLLGDESSSESYSLNGADGRYGHQRRSSKSSTSSANEDGIHTNRKKSLFTIISDRYEKSAYPVLLRKKTR